MKILIVTAFFPPFNAIASGRPYSWAKYWSRAGHDVTVLTVQRPPEPADSPQPMTGFQVIRTPLPRPAWTRLWPRYDATKRSYASSATSPGTPGLVRRLWRAARSHYGFMSMIRMPDVHDAWANHSIGAVRADAWDVVVSTGGPYSVHYVGQALRRSGAARRWCVDWRDLWTRNSIYPGLPGVRWLERRIENSFHRDADLVTTVSLPLAEILRDMCDTPVQVVYNGFEPADIFALPADSAFPNDGVFRIVYTGTLYPTRHDPTPFFASLARLQREGAIDPTKFELVLAGACQQMLEIAERYGVRALVNHRGMLPRSEALRMQRDAQALLLIGFRGTGQEGVLTGKIFEYLSAGPPVLAVASDAGSSIGEVLNDSGRGAALGTDVDVIAAQIRRWLAQPRMPKFEAQFDERVLQYTRERQAMLLLEMLT